MMVSLWKILSNIFFSQREVSESRIKVRSVTNGRYYLVNNVDPELSVSILSHIHDSLCYLCCNLSSQSDPALQKIAKAVSTGMRLEENPRKFPKKNMTSYSVNKGDKIVMCIIDYRYSPPIPFDMNTIMYVALHELAHIGDNNTGHTNSFKRVFSLILTEAERLRIWTPSGAGGAQTFYCGINI